MPRKHVQPQPRLVELRRRLEKLRVGMLWVRQMERDGTRGIEGYRTFGETEIARCERAIAQISG